MDDEKPQRVPPPLKKRVRSYFGVPVVSKNLKIFLVKIFMFLSLAIAKREERILLTGRF